MYISQNFSLIIFDSNIFLTFLSINDYCERKHTCMPKKRPMPYLKCQ